MHGAAGLHSAMAIKRQRRIREQQAKEQAKRRAHERDRRLSSSTNSIDSGDHRPIHRTQQPSDNLVTSIGMLHLGVCFLVLGIFLIGSGLLPDDIVTWRSGGWWNELLATGLFVAALGIFLISLNRVMTKKEEEDLNEYVQSQLTRSRSGHRLERDVETGCLTTKNHRRYMERRREDKERGLSDDDLPKLHSPSPKNADGHFVYQNGDAHLERILEEEGLDRSEIDSRRADAFNKETISNTTTASLSPGTPSETRELISNGRHHSHSTKLSWDKYRDWFSSLEAEYGLPRAPPNEVTNAVEDEPKIKVILDGRALRNLGKGLFTNKVVSPLIMVSALQIIVGCLLLGAIVLVVGLVQLTPNAADADHRYIFLSTGSILLLLGLIMTAVRCFCMHCAEKRAVEEDQPPPLDAINSIDVLVQRRDTQVTSPSELDALITKQGQEPECKECSSEDT